MLTQGGRPHLLESVWRDEKQAPRCEDAVRTGSASLARTSEAALGGAPGTSHAPLRGYDPTTDPTTDTLVPLRAVFAAASTRLWEPRFRNGPDCLQKSLPGTGRGCLICYDSYLLSKQLLWF